MALLIRCTNCSILIRQTDDACPFCRATRRPRSRAAAVVGAAALSLALGGCTDGKSMETGPPDTETTETLGSTSTGATDSVLPATSNGAGEVTYGVPDMSNSSGHMGTDSDGESGTAGDTDTDTGTSGSATDTDPGSSSGSGSSGASSSSSSTSG